MTEKPAFICIDTEFLREKTYYAKLCLIQVSGPGIAPYTIDPLDSNAANAMDDLKAMLFDLDIIKVLHSGFQDLEIFYHLTGEVVAPIFDTQIAASVLGYGEQVSYAALVKDLLGVEISKAHQFSDWSLRPLSQAQIDYALGDVIHLQDIYPMIIEKLSQRSRDTWITEDFKRLESAETYQPHPENLWQKIKIRSDKPKHLSVLRELAIWREQDAARRNLPKSFILKDDALSEIAMTAPKDKKALTKLRGFPASQAEKPIGKAVLKAVEKGLSIPNEDMPRKQKSVTIPKDKAALMEMLRLLLKITAAQNDITPSRIASSDDLQAIALHGDKTQVSALSGWRYDIFGHHCVDLIKGKSAIGIQNNQIKLIDI